MLLQAENSLHKLKWKGLMEKILDFGMGPHGKKTLALLV